MYGMTTNPTTKASDQHFGRTADAGSPVDQDELRDEVRAKYAAVATDPEADYHFHTGRVIAERCRYDMAAVDQLPTVAVESFAGVANPFEHRALQPGERVVDLGSGAGMDSFLAARAVGPTGYVVGIDMTPSMLTKARTTASTMGLGNVEFCDNHIENVPVADGWADVVISNGVVNLSPDKVLVGLTHGAEEPENVLIAYLMGVEALRAGKETAMWLTKNGADIAVAGFAETVDVPGAPSIADLHDEFVERGGRFLACRVCMKLRGHYDAVLTTNAEIVGAPAVFEYTTGGALVFNY